MSTDTKNQIILDLVAALKDVYYSRHSRPQPDVFTLVQRAYKIVEEGN